MPLSAPARQLLAALPRDGELVFPGRGGAHRSDIKKPWAAICKAAKITGVRVHDLQAHLRLGARLIRRQPPHHRRAARAHSTATTSRYAHLVDDPLRTATETAGAVISGSKSAEVLPITGRRKARR